MEFWSDSGHFSVSFLAYLTRTDLLERVILTSLQEYDLNPITANFFGEFELYTNVKKFKKFKAIKCS